MDINFRFLKKDDLKGDCTKWMQDVDVTKYNSHGLFPKTKEDEESFIESLDSKNNCVFGIFHTFDEGEVSSYPETARMWFNLKAGTHIGNVALQNINWINRSAELAILIGDKSHWGKGIATKACKHVLSHGFKSLNLNRIWTGTSATNVGMQKVCEKIGMTKEGVFRQGMFLEGEWADIYTYAILQSEMLVSVRNSCDGGGCSCKKDNKSNAKLQQVLTNSWNAKSGASIKRGIEEADYNPETCEQPDTRKGSNE